MGVGGKPGDDGFPVLVLPVPGVGRIIRLARALEEGRIQRQLFRQDVESGEFQVPEMQGLKPFPAPVHVPLAGRDLVRHFREVQGPAAQFSPIGRGGVPVLEVLVADRVRNPHDDVTREGRSTQFRRCAFDGCVQFLQGSVISEPGFRKIFPGLLDGGIPAIRDAEREVPRRIPAVDAEESVEKPVGGSVPVPVQDMGTEAFFRPAGRRGIVPAQGDQGEVGERGGPASPLFPRVQVVRALDSGKGNLDHIPFLAGWADTLDKQLIVGHRLQAVQPENAGHGAFGAGFQGKGHPFVRSVAQ